MTIPDHHNRPNWVDERGRCTLESKFKELIETVCSDVEEVKKQISRVRHGQLFTVEEPDEKGFIRVRRYPEHRPNDASGYVNFELGKKKITVHLPDEVSFNVIPEWNEEELRCDLLIDGKPQELWRISQRALGSFFFEIEE